MPSLSEEFDGTRKCVAKEYEGMTNDRETWLSQYLPDRRGKMAKTIMVVDDAAVVRQVVSMALKNAGYAVIEAVNGKDALFKMNGNKVEMVITDLNMPEMDGIEFIRNLRKSSEYRFMPIVMLTTASQEHKKKEGKEAGASGWIIKPFTARDLLDTIKKFVG